MAVAHAAEGSPAYDKIHSVALLDDFTAYLTGGLWTTLADSSGSTAQDDTAGADTIKTTTAASASDKQGFTTTKAPFLPIDGQSMWWETLVNFASVGGTRTQAVYSGFFSSTPQGGAGTAVPAVSYTGAIVYALNGDTTWRVQVSNGATKTNYTTNAPVVEGIWNRLRVDVIKRDSANVQVTFTLNGETLRDVNTGLVIIATIALASMVKMKAGGFIQSGGSAEVANWDYATFSKARMSNI